MPHRSLAQEIFDALFRVVRAQRHRMHPRDLTPGETFILSHIHHCAEGDGIRVSDIAAKMRVSTSGVTQFVKALESRGLVERKRGRDDRRVVLLATTAKGREMMRASLDRMIETFARLVDSIGATEGANLRDQLLRVAEFLEHDSSINGEEPC
jgi:DNA-binding MarR family transcriptional regulator